MTSSTPERACSRCRAEPALPYHRLGRLCKRADDRARAARAKAALAICKRAGLAVVVANSSGFACAPSVAAGEPKNRPGEPGASSEK